VKSSIAVDHESAQSFADNSGAGRWLSVKEFSAAASISERSARHALAKRLTEGGAPWRKAQLLVRVAASSGGPSGTRYEVALESLPRDVRDAYLAAEASAAIEREDARRGPIPAVVAGAQATLAEAEPSGISTQERQAGYESEAARFERQPAGVRKEAHRRAAVLRQLDDMQRETRLSVSRCAEALSKSLPEKPSKDSILRWRRRVGDHPRHTWAYFVAPTWGNKEEHAQCHPKALDVIKADYLRREAPTFSSCYRRLCDAAKVHQWSIPSEDTLMRWIQKTVPAEVIALARGGQDALKKLLPSQQRDHSIFGALEAVNADGFDFKLWAVMEDGEVTQPCMVHWQCVYSGKILSKRLGPTENTELYQTSFGDLVRQFGIPRHAYLDNTRAAANKTMTGGVPNRYRFKVVVDELKGVLPLMGVDVHWSTPGHGQAKPIERANRELRDTLEKHPLLAGAFSKRGAVSISKLRDVVDACIYEHNARAGRRSPACAGRSFDQTFSESFARRAELIQHPTETQLRLLLLSAKEVTASRVSGSFELYGNRYWSEFMTKLAGTKIQVRFDPNNLRDGAHVYASDGRYVGFAACIQRAGFNDTSAAKDVMRDRARLKKNSKDSLEIHRRLNAREVAALIPAQPARSTPIPKVRRGYFGKSRPEHLGNASPPLATTGSSAFDAAMENLAKSQTCFNPKKVML